MYFRSLFAVILPGLAVACASPGAKPTDTSFRIAEVQVSMSPGADSRSEIPISEGHISALRDSVLQTAAKEPKPGAPKRLLVTVDRFGVASFAGALVGGDTNAVISRVLVQDIASGADEGGYRSDHMTGTRYCCNMAAPPQPVRAAAITATSAGVRIWHDAYRLGRLPYAELPIVPR